jgi:HD-GYP domain-containing protein (c-di-GMP phosphodiesterase class II)
VPRSILEKNGALTVEEWDVLQEHSEDGWRILASVEWAAPLAAIVRGHHERWDGAGYPDHLRGEQIPVEARILAVADTVDAMTTDRPYRKALSMSTALSEIEAFRGRQFDPAIVDVALSIPPEDWEALRRSVSMAALEVSLRRNGAVEARPPRRLPETLVRAAAG